MNGALALATALGLIVAFGVGLVRAVGLAGSDRTALRRDVLPVVRIVMWRTLVLLKASFQVFKWSLIVTLAITLGGIGGLAKMNTSSPRRR